MRVGLSAQETEKLSEYTQKIHALNGEIQKATGDEKKKGVLKQLIQQKESLEKKRDALIKKRELSVIPEKKAVSQPATKIPVINSPKKVKVPDAKTESASSVIVKLLAESNVNVRHLFLTILLKASTKRVANGSSSILLIC